MLSTISWWLLPVAATVGVAMARFIDEYVDRIRAGAPVSAGTLARALASALRANDIGKAPLRLSMLCGGLLLLAWVPLSWADGHAEGPEAFLRAAVCVVLISLALIDARTGFLPDALTLPCLYGGLLAALAGYGPSVLDAAAGALLGYGFLWLFNAIYVHLRGRIGMGGGDMKLLAALGAWLGWMPLPNVLAAACVGGVMFSLLRPGQCRWSRPLAFGPFLAGAGAVGLVAPPVVQFPF